MPVRNNATGFTIERWYIGADPRPTWTVTWDNSMGEGDYDGDERKRDFRSLASAFRFCEKLVANYEYENSRLYSDLQKAGYGITVPK